MKAGGLALYDLIQPTISLEMPVPREYLKQISNLKTTSQF
jgi:hypothetical protein